MKNIKINIFRFLACSFFCIIGVVVSIQFSFAQQQAGETLLLKESVHLHLPQRSFMPGETMWFKLYVTGEHQKLSGASRVAYVELMNMSGSVVWQTKTVVENGTAQGSWRLPSSVSTGIYILRSYTSRQLISGIPLMGEKVAVLNPSRGLPQALQVPKPAAENSSLQEDTILRFSSLKEQYDNRALVSFSISGEPSASLSVAVFKADSLDFIFKNQHALSLKYPAVHLSVAEYSGHLIRGKVTNRKTNKPMNGVRVYLSVPGKRFYFNTNVSDQDGNVFFEMGDVYGTEQVIVYPADIADSNVIINLENPFLKDTLITENIPLQIAESLRPTINRRIAEFSLRQLFDKSGQEKYYYPGQFDTTAFFGKPDKVYFLDDYTRFRSLEEVLREYVPEVELRRSAGKFAFRLLNQPFRRSFDGNPLVLLDGVAVQDINKLMELDPLKIRKMELVTRRYFLGDMSFEGIISLSTYLSDLGGFQLSPNAILLDYPGLQLQQQFAAPTYDSPQLSNARWPDLRNMLLWEPDAAADESGSIPVLFYTGDLSGEFVVDVKGYSVSGKPIHVRRSFRVGKE